ncbi:MAG: metalloregulator ArsR/SmtB family transcription factor [Sulfurimonas sp.]|uniref:ArsR/SmtB family transcription factor n=1 Tax=Sulfurimonas sp. TaxID=2022749 RepID=UPI0026398EC8|nr:metalloregulator ArsR/SmtB family transcription factor [Sulfurimonas sp.]MDD3477209.1 metalloregulator ArsR/SmtB family transcription factor [Sulfurimonas sp.]
MLDMQQKIKIFKALGNETRFLIFKNVFTGGYVCSIEEKNKNAKINAHATCVSTIAQHFEFSLPTISKHLQLLREAGVIKMQKKANKIYIEPNIETIRELGGCFTKLVENFETNRELFFDDIIVK